MPLVLFATLLATASLITTLCAQTAPVPATPLAPLVRGTLDLWTGSDSQGWFSIDVPESGVHRCAFTSRTYFEEDHRRTSISRIAPGQWVELLSERVAEPPRCRALIVRVIHRGRPSTAASRTSALAQAYGASPRIRVYGNPSATEWFAPRGNLVFSGVVIKLDAQTMTLRMRNGERRLLQLRPDTRYQGAGEESSREHVPLNRPLQVRAGKTYDNQLEAFIITWGEILQVD